MLEPYFHTDHAAAAVRIVQERRTTQYGEHANDDLVFGVRVVPRPEPNRY